MSMFALQYYANQSFNTSVLLEPPDGRNVVLEDQHFGSAKEAGGAILEPRDPAAAFLPLASAEAARFIESLASGPTEIGLAMLEMTKDMWLKGTIGIRLQELLRLRAAQLAECRSALRLRIAEAMEAGVGEALIADLVAPERAALAERERLALQYAELLITGPDGISDGLYEELRRHYSESEIVELSYFTLQCNAVYRFSIAMRAVPTECDRIETRRLFA